MSESTETEREIGRERDDRDRERGLLVGSGGGGRTKGGGERGTLKLCDAAVVARWASWWGGVGFFRGLGLGFWGFLRERGGRVARWWRGAARGGMVVAWGQRTEDRRQREERNERGKWGRRGEMQCLCFIYRWPINLNYRWLSRWYIANVSNFFLFFFRSASL